MRILFVTWGEVPRMSSVYNGQVVNVIRELKKLNPSFEIKLLAGVPFLHSGMFREKLAYKDQVKKISDAIGAENFIWRSIFVPPVGVSPKRWQLPFFVAFQMRALRRLISNFKPDVLHCRSYVATWVAHKVRNEMGLDFKIVFDARSFMPDECIVTGRWTLNSPDHRFWIETERRLLAKSDVTIAVSGTMKAHFETISVKRCEIIYLNVDCVDVPETPNLTYKPNNPKILAYCGYLGSGGWHDDAELWRLFRSVRIHIPNARLVLITKSSRRNLETILNKPENSDIKDHIQITSAESPADCLTILRTCDIGLLSYRNPVNTQEIKLAHSVFATKTAEYLVAGLPIIVNKYCGGAKDFVMKNDCGVFYDPEIGVTSQDVVKLEKFGHDRDRIRILAIKEFAAHNNATKITNIYREILSD
jgi:glycosyltransferase involved in cell wall biosynthesis